MTGTTVDIENILRPDHIGCEIGNKYLEWQSARRPKLAFWEELRQYIFATDTTQTSNSSLPWSNKTTLPKLCQIRDNLFSNYMAATFPKRKSMTWIAEGNDPGLIQKRDLIINFSNYCTTQNRYKSEIAKCILDYIDYGNAFATVEFVDERIKLEDRMQVGYVGPAIQRISPLDIVFNPIAPSFEKTPKIIRSILSIGELKKLLNSFTTPENKEAYEELWTYFRELRDRSGRGGEFKSKDDLYNIEGFQSYQAYLSSSWVEILTFYGDIYDEENDTLLENHVIMVADRHKVINKKPNPSYFGYPPIFHVGWRIQQDNLWAMGPLDNLVGLQYRLDHVENSKADLLDLIRIPPVKIKGYVDNFTWGPMERIYCDEESDVELMSPDVNSLQANMEVDRILALMEEMAGAPKEAMGFRTPGEKTAFEVQRLENAASRIFNNKSMQFDEQFIEKLQNAMLECARRNITDTITIPVLDDEFQFTTFVELTGADLVGNGRLKPMAARHFAERAELVQNLSNFSNSSLGQDPSINSHFSGIKMAKILEEALDLQDYELYRPFVRLSEQAEAQRLANTAQEQLAMEQQTASGLKPDDYDLEGPSAPLLQGLPQ